MRVEDFESQMLLCHFMLENGMMKRDLKGNWRSAEKFKLLTH